MWKHVNHLGKSLQGCWKEASKTSVCSASYFYSDTSIVRGYSKSPSLLLPQNSSNNFCKIYQLPSGNPSRSIPRLTSLSSSLRLPPSSNLSCNYSTSIYNCSPQIWRRAGVDAISLPRQQPRRGFLSAVSVNGFNDYELERKNFKFDVPEYFNFASDVIDQWARKEETGERSTNIPAFWWIDPQGREIKMSFQDLKVTSKKVANLLTGVCNIKPQDRVMVILPRIPEWWLLNLACLRTGAVMLPGTTQLRAGDIRDRVQKSGAVCIITNEELAEQVDQVSSECESLQTKVLITDKDEPNIERPGWLDYNKLYEEASEEHECVKTRSDDPMTIFFTSGTTGKPKMAEHTHASYGLGHILTGKFWMDACPTDIVWNLSDTGWAKAAYGNLFGPWTQGACVFIENMGLKFSAKRTLQVLNDHPITIMCGPATAYTLMVQEKPASYNIKSVRSFVSGGEHLNPEVNYAWKKETDSYILEGYGQTETVIVAGMFRCLEMKPGSCGKAVPGYDVSIVDEDGNELPRGHEGIIGVRVKPTRPIGLFTGYVEDPERNAAVFKGDFYLTGDRASMDKDGYLWMIGRSDDVISSAGYRIGPYEVESALLEHPAVAEVAVVSSPDELRGEVVKAFIVLAESYRSAEADPLIKELQEHVKSTTAPYKYPRKIEFRESLPKTISNKVRRVELRQEEWSQQA